MGSVLFVQLPPPRFSFCQAPVNIPLAAGFMIAALGNKAADGQDRSIIEESIASVYADMGLLEAVVQRQPSVLALTLYVWNVQRSLFLAGRVKDRLPNTKILVGGPEVTPDNEWLLRHPAVDAGVFGEGESRIGGVLEALAGNRSVSDIPGTFSLLQGALCVNKEEATPWDLTSCIYPYMGKIISPSRSGTIFVETVRGCPFQCRYCYYHKAFRSLRSHGLDAVKNCLEWAYKPDSRVTELYLMDPSFNVTPHYYDVLKYMAELKKQNAIRGHTELRADFLDRDDPKRLVDAGVASVEVGLQSTNPEALRQAGRTGDVERVARGVGLLKRECIEVTTGIILGLPGDTPEDFQKTLDWLRVTDAYSVVHPFLLSVLPGTDFRRRAEQLGLAFDPRPPYFVRSTPTFSEDGLRDAILSCEEVFDMELDHIDLPSLVDNAPDLVASLDSAAYVSKWVIDPAKKTWKSRLTQLLAKATDPFVLWFRGLNCSRSENDIVRILGAFYDANPHAFVHIVFEYISPPRPRFLERLVSAVAQPGVYVNKSMQSWVKGTGVVSPSFTVLLHDPVEETARKQFLDAYEDLATIVWDLGFPDDEIICRATTPFLVSASLKPGSSYGYLLFNTLRRCHGRFPEDVLFRDIRMQQFWLRSMNRWEPEGFTEQIVMDID